MQLLLAGLRFCSVEKMRDTIAGSLSLRNFQSEALSALQKSGDGICVAPTGSGKSLIFEQHAKLSVARTLLISPLVALVRQQTLKFLKIGVKTYSFHQIQKAGREPGVCLTSPEALFHQGYESGLEKVRNWKPDFIVVDEAHCVWEWGSGFRPSFSFLPRFVSQMGPRNSLWLTATLTREMRENLKRQLAPRPFWELGKFQLPKSLGLRLVKIPLVDGPLALKLWLDKNMGGGIIFVHSRQSTARLALLIQALGRNPICYHAGMSAEERRSIESHLHSGKGDILVATSAFGMGMDFTSLDWVLLWQMPSSVLSFTQMVGRVGRSVKSGTALCFWHDDDFRLLEWLTHLPNGEGSRRSLQELYEIALSDTCREQILQQYFDVESQPHPCGRCDVCELKL